MESAARTRSQPATPVVEVIALTADPALLATLREATGPAHQLLHAESADAAVELLVAGHLGILIVDVAVVGTSEIANLVDKLQAQFPEMLLLATGRREEQLAVASLVGSGRIYRFLHKPVSPARAELFVSAAVRRHGELHPQVSRAALAMRTLRGASSRNFAVVGVAVLLLGVGGWLWSQRKAPLSQQTVAELAPPSAAERTTTILAEANAARAAGRLAPPEHNNAFDLYQSALRADPTNSIAAAAIRDITTTLERQVASALSAGDMRAAQRGIESLKLVEHDAARLGALQKQLAELAIQRAPAQSPSVASTPTPEATITTPRAPAPAPARNANVQLAKAFLAANQLVEPTDASALGQLRSAREAREDQSAIQITATDLGTRLLNRALDAVTAGDLDQARAAYDAAMSVDREFETSLPDLAMVATRIQALQAATQAAALRDRIARASKLRANGQLIEPAGENAFELLQSIIKDAADSPDVSNERQQLSFALLERTRTALAAGEIDRADVLATRAEETLPGLAQTKALRQQIGEARQRRDDANALAQAASLVRRRETPAVYPDDALLRGIEGWVDLEFTINERGVPENLVVKAATPPRVFDSAALFALRQWRFEPIIRDGAPRAQRATLRMEFRLEQ